MADCVCVPGCPFFNDKMKGRPATIQMYKLKYCQGDFSSCARFMVFQKLGKGNVPIDLFPNEREKAEDIIKNNQ